MDPQFVVGCALAITVLGICARVALRISREKGDFEAGVRAGWFEVFLRAKERRK